MKNYLMNLPFEVWEAVDGYNDYKVSNYGRVKSYKRNRERLLKPYRNTDNYLQITFCQDGSKKKFLLHRVIAETFLPNPLGKELISHRDGNIQNNSLDNLYYATTKEIHKN
mgnify:CR=1 FL=1